jgi:hypothetical protein
VNLDFSYSGPSLIQCNAPTQIELKWTASGAQDIALYVDGGPAIAHYHNGAQDELIPLTCDGRSHTYTLKATASGVNVTRSITVQTNSIA